MPKEFSRQVRVADQLQRTLAQLIQTGISDPRVGMVNVNEVNVSRDYASARVYVTFVGDQSHSSAEESVAVLNKAAGYLRSQLARTLNSRTTPRLHFVYDRSALEGQRLRHLIDEAVEADRHH